MKRSGMLVITLCAVAVLAGCRSKPKIESDDTMFDYMQEQVAKITDKGGMSAVGVADSRSMPMALSKAKVTARKNLAQLVETKIENLEKSFAEEIGQSSGSEINTLFSSATKQITSQTLQGSVPQMQKYEERDGITYAYVLMVMNPDIIDDALKSQNSMKHLYERFRASKAFEELDKEIREFEEAEKAGIMNM